MSEVSPRAMLKMYRLESSVFDNEQTELFLAMPPSDRMELLFYMCFHNNKILQYLHNKIEPGAAEITGAPPEPGVN